MTRTVRHKPDWLVRRYVTLSLFEFGKILLYLDLDPTRWPVARPLAENCLVRQILIGGEEREEGGGLISDPDMSPAAMLRRDLKLELVDRADSSQCEALEVALSGKDLVVQGPRGPVSRRQSRIWWRPRWRVERLCCSWPKSLPHSKSFVGGSANWVWVTSALNCTAIGLRKLEVIQDIADRYRAAAHLQPPADYETALTRLTARRAALSEYIEIICAPAGALTDLTVGDALMQAGHARRKLGTSIRPLVAMGPSALDYKSLNWARLADAKGRLGQLAAAITELRQQGAVERHPWAGVSATEIMPHDHERLSVLLSEWADSAERVAEVTVEAWARISAGDQAVAAETFVALGVYRSAAAQAEVAARAAEQVFKRSFPRSPVGAGHLAALIEAAAATPLTAHAGALPYSMEPDAGAWLFQHGERLRTLKEARAKLLECFRSDAFDARPNDIEEWSAALAQRGLFAPLGSRWRVAGNAWKAIARPNVLKLSAKKKSELLADLRDYILDVTALAADAEVSVRLGKDGTKLEFDTKPLEEVARWAAMIRATMTRSLGDELLAAPTEALAELGEVRIGQVLGRLHGSGPIEPSGRHILVARRGSRRAARAATDGTSGVPGQRVDQPLR